MTVDRLINNIKGYVDYQMNSLTANNPMIGFIKPLITRAIDKNLNKAYGTIKLIADEEGNIDIENILSEMMDSVISNPPFTVNNSLIGDIVIGGGEIKLNIPFTNKRLVLNKSDLDIFKEMMTKN